ncbi:MAG: zf-HC2 domain-containing protein [Clostridia bacterium]|nr:zf-HC2 domain-containing protein [Clostridia bacterium]
MPEDLNDCKIIQDLMPLVIDEACSEESRRAVEAHVAGCTNCAKIYETMKAAVPAPAVDANEDHTITNLNY